MAAGPQDGESRPRLERKTEMRLRATVQLRNDHMLSARAKKGLTQANVASMAGVSQGLISCLERLIFPMSYRYEEALLIADVLEIEPELVMPERMVGWKGQTKFMTVAEVPIEKLLAYKNTVESHYLLNSPDEAIEGKDDLVRVKMMIGRLPERLRLIINLRYGLDQELGGPYSQSEVAERLETSSNLVSLNEQKALRLLQSMAGNDLLMEHINAVSLDKIEDEVSLDEMACGELLLTEISAKPLKKLKVKK